MVTRTGFEPVYACVKGMCVKPLHQRAISKMAVQTGIEPAISCVTGRHVNRYTTGPY